MHWVNLTWILIAFRKLVGLSKRGLLSLARKLPGLEGQRRLSSGRWQRLPAFSRHFITNLVVGLGIALVLHQFHHTSLVLHLEDSVIDWAMRMYRGTAPERDVRPIAFIDIDEASYRQWGEPLFTPRDKLAGLIRHAIDGDAAAIMVDIDLSRSLGPGHQALIDVLGAYGADADADADGDRPAPPPLILARTFRLPLPGDVPALPEERASFLDALVAQAPAIHWGAPLFDLDGDGKVRRWHLWEAVCDPEGSPRVRPSVQLLTKALLDAGAEQRRVLAERLDQAIPVDCTLEGDTQAHRDHHPDMIDLGDDAISLLPHRIERRILYRIPWHLADGEARPLVGLDGHQVPLLSVRSAGAIGDAAGPLSSDWLRGHLVIIGSSYGDSRDLYQTPIGLMPGALILANAVLSFGSHGELRAPNLLETLVLETLLILIMSYLFARFDSFWGSLLSGVTVILLLLPLSLWLVGAGYWLSFAIPLIAVQIHQSASELEEALAHRDSKEHPYG